MRLRPTLLLFGAALAAALPQLGNSVDRKSSSVTLMRVINDGLQPQVVRDEKGVTHLLYYQGDPAHCDLFYTYSTNDGTTWYRLIRVNAIKGDAIAMGNVRGGQLAVGRNGMVHVVWIGSKWVYGQPTDGGLSVMYARLNPDGKSFEPERNLQGHTFNIDGGDSVAADPNGNVYVVWHATADQSAEEKDRKVWIAVSGDDGKTFQPEHTVWNESTGACGCCSLKTLFSDGRLWIAYRAAQDNAHRDPYLIRSVDNGRFFYGQKISDWLATSCPTSTFSLFGIDHKLYEAWERRGIIQWSAWAGEPSHAVGKNAKYPVIVANKEGEMMVAWTENMSWQKGGDLAWQVYDRSGKPVYSQSGRAPGVPANSLIAAFAKADGSFAILY